MGREVSESQPPRSKVDGEHSGSSSHEAIAVEQGELRMTVKQGRHMGRILGIGAGALAFAGLVGSATAVELGADDEVRYVQRDMVLPPMTVSPWLDMRVIRIGGGLGGIIEYSQNIGAKFVPLENLQIKASPVSFYAGDFSGYGTAGLGAMYRFVNEEMFEMGVELNVPVGSTGRLGAVGMSGGFPMRLHIKDSVRIDTGLFVTGLFDTNFSNQAQFGLAKIDDAPIFVPDPMIPIEASFQIIDEIFVGLDTGFGAANIDDAGDTIFIPFGFRFGGTVPMDGRPFVDLSTGFRWPAFILTGSPDTVEAGYFEIQLVRADFHFDLN
jgi:hypothetical protein